MQIFESLKGSNPVVIILGVILIPVSVAVVSLWADARNEQRQRELSQMLSERQQRLSITQMVDTYFQGIGDALLGPMDTAMRDKIIVARTRALLKRLSEPGDSALIVRFIADIRQDLLHRPARKLEKSKRPYIELTGLDLHGIDLSFVNLGNSDLSGANLSGADLTWANLANSNLRNANLQGAILNGTEFRKADLRGTNLQGAILGGASFVEADLSAADLRDAELADFEFDGLRIRVDFSRTKLAGTLWVKGHRCRNANDPACSMSQ